MQEPRHIEDIQSEQSFVVGKLLKNGISITKAAIATEGLNNNRKLLALQKSSETDNYLNHKIPALMRRKKPVPATLQKGMKKTAFEPGIQNPKKRVKTA
jgi:hypothetical protein